MSHKKKSIEIVQLSAGCYHTPVTESLLEEAKLRVPQMREDSLYVRLKETPNNEIKPSNRYWKKRALGYFKFLNDILKNIDHKNE